MKKPTAAEIASKYGANVRRACAVCALSPEVKAIIRSLRNEHHLSFRKISRALLGEFNAKINEGSLNHHLQNHEAA